MKNAQVTIKENGKMVRIGGLVTVAEARAMVASLKEQGILAAFSY